MPTERDDLIPQDPPPDGEQEFGLPNAPGDDTDYGTVSTRGKKGVYIPLTPEGTIDQGRFRPKNRAAFDFALKNSPTFSSSTAPAFVMDRDSIGLLYDGVAMSLQAVGKILFKWQKELTDHLVYTDEQKEHLKEPTAKVIEKYAPEWLLKHQELVMLAMVFSTETKRMVENAASQYVAQKEYEARQKVQSQPANGSPQVRTHVEYEPAGAGN